MAPVRHLMGGMLVAVAIIFPVQPHAQPAATQATEAPSLIDRWQGFIAEASRRFGLPEAWIRAVMRAESGGNPRALSPKGAMGLMQIMPATWAELRARYGLGADPYDPHDNIFAATAYLRKLYKRYGYPDLFAAYNAGPARFDTYLFNGKPLPDETRTYLARLGQPTFEQPSAPVVASGTSLFFPLKTAARTPLNPPPTPSSDGLFVPLNTMPDGRQ